MKHLIVVLLCCTCIPAWAGDDKNMVSSVLRSAIVYRSGAELMHTAKTNLLQGNNELVIDHISNRIDMNSLQIGANGAITIMSVEFSTNFLRPEKKSPVIKRLEDSLNKAENDLKQINVVLNTDQELLDLLKANKEIRGDQTGVSVAELAKMMEYYKSKTLELEHEMSRYRDKAVITNDIIDKLKQQIKEEEQKNSKTIGRLQLQVYCPVAGSYEFNVSYVTPAAYWTPTYDLRVENISKPVSLSYKARLMQITGIDWKQVKLALSTSVPAQHNNAPDIRSWFLRYANSLSDVEKKAKSSMVMAAESSERKSVVVGSTPISLRGMATADANSELAYIVNGNVVSREAFQNINKKAIKSVNVLKAREAANVYGAVASNGAVVVTLKDELGDYVDIRDNELNVVFDIDLPYDVPSNGKEQNVNLKEFKVPAMYRYYTVPRMDRDAYLVGGVVHWESLNLLPGEANIIFEGTYIGKTAINPGSTSDTLNLTLGRDKRVVVKREKLTDFSSVKFLGSNKKQTFTYEITVRNNKKEKIQIELKDQYPLSTTKDIEVELLQHDGAVVEEETGILTWKLELGAGEVKKYRVSYSVKYPKDKAINL